LERNADRADLLEPLLREALAKSPSPETRRRIESLLSLPRLVRLPQHLRSIRAIQALEQIGTPAAQQILQRLAAGAPDAPETRGAKSCSGTLGKTIHRRALNGAGRSFYGSDEPNMVLLTVSAIGLGFLP
jgi:hypothetical protein